MHLRWQPRPWLLGVALVALLPAMLLWTAAVGDSLGITHLLTALPTAANASSRPERLLLLVTFLVATLGLPGVAVLSGALAILAIDLRIARWEVTARLRFPAPSWTLPQLVALVLLLGAAALFMAMAGHLAADCLVGTDCVST
jgi:hypothetical protein